MKHKIMLLGEPGVGKSLAGLSYPGVEQHVWGANEDDSSKNFPGREDILPPVKFDWRDCYTDKDREEMTKLVEKEEILEKHKLLAPYKLKARARNVAKYIDYIEGLSNDLKAGKRDEVKSVFLDNFTPFSEDLWAYTQMLHLDDYTEKNMWNIHTDYQNYLKHVIDTLRQMDVHTIFSLHVIMELDEEMKSKTNFLEQAKVASRKEWQPNIMGKFKYQLAGRFTFAFHLYTEENAGQDTKYLGKIVADSQNVGVAKSRINPFEGMAEHSNGRKIKMPKGTFYQFLEDAINKKGGK